MLGLAAAAHALGGGSGCVGEPCGVRGEGALGQPGVGHRFERERPDAVEQPVSDGHRRTLVVDDHERTAREPADHVDRRGCRHVERFEDELDRRQRRAAGEGGQGPQAPLVVGEQQLVAPPDRRLECPAAFRSAAGRVAQHVEAIVEAPGDLLDRQRLGSCRGELDRQRQTVERAAQVEHRVVGLAGGRVSALRGGPTGEQLDGVGRARGVRARTRPHRRRRAEPGWCTGSAARGRRRGGERRAPRRRR